MTTTKWANVYEGRGLSNWCERISICKMIAGRRKVFCLLRGTFQDGKLVAVKVVDENDNEINT